MSGGTPRPAPPWLFWTVTGVVSMVLHFGFRMNVWAAVGIGVVAALASIWIAVEIKRRQR